MKLTKKDKEVIDAFTEGYEATSKNLTSTGRRLDGNWLGGRGIASWEGTAIPKIVMHDLGSRAAQTVQRALRSMTPSQWLARENPIPEDELLLDKFNPDDVINPWPELSRVNGKLAVVMTPMYDSTTDYDPETMALRYHVFMSDVEAEPQFIGARAHWKSNSTPFTEQQTYYRSPSMPYGYEYSLTLQEPFAVWVPKKLKDLSLQQSMATEQWLREHGYIENTEYPASQAKIRKLLKVPTFAETQELDSELANIADSWVNPRTVWGDAPPGDPASEEARWRVIKGVYLLNRKGNLKTVIPRNTAKKNPESDVELRKAYRDHLYSKYKMPSKKEFALALEFMESEFPGLFHEPITSQMWAEGFALGGQYSDKPEQWAWDAAEQSMPQLTPKKWGQIAREAYKVAGDFGLNDWVMRGGKNVF